MNKKLIKLLFVALISVISLGSNCFKGDSQKGIKTYKVEGKITITNNCTNNTADIADKIFVEKELTFTSADNEKFSKNNIQTNPVAGAANQKDANYDFSITTTNAADKWVKKRIKTNSFGDICANITCPDSNHSCKDTATNVNEVSATDNNNQTTVTKNYTVTCTCQEPSE